MRKMVSVQVVKELIAISGADRIELCIINGWQCIVAKGMYKVGDLVLYAEIDTFLNAVDPRFESFAERFINWEGKRGLRVKTIKLKKQLSQGLVLSLDNFPEVKNPVVGMDATEAIGAEKWEIVEKACNVPGAQGTKSFPTFIRKTDQNRLQNVVEMAERAMDEEFEITTKKDGSSMTVFRVDPDSPYYKAAKALYATKMTFWQKMKAFFSKQDDSSVYGICSRNVLLPLVGDSNFHVAAAPVLEAIKTRTGSYAIQGEVVAPDIQQNYEKVAGVEFHIFDMFGIDRQKYLTPKERQLEITLLGLKHVSIVKECTLRGFTGDNKDFLGTMLKLAEGVSDNKEVMREGLVFKAMNRDFSFKTISNSYLLKKG